MKKIVLVAGFLFAGMFASVAQLKEGTITYSVSIENLPPEAAGMMKGTELKICFKGDKTRSDFTSAFQSTTTISDPKESITLMDQMGQKYLLRTKNGEDPKKKGTKKPEPTITYLNETKTIAGYACKKAIINSVSEKGDSASVQVWYAENLRFNSANKFFANFKTLKGAPLEFVNKQGPWSMSFTATNISDSPVPNSKFDVSTEGYTEITEEDLKGMMRGGAGN